MGGATLRWVGATTLFCAVFLLVQWKFSAFLISPAADNAFFAGHGRFFGYMSRRDEWRGVFWHADRSFTGASQVAWMWLIALGAALLGTGAGVFLSRIRR